MNRTEIDDPALAEPVNRNGIDGKPAIIPWWRLLIYVAILVLIAFGCTALIQHLIGRENWITSSTGGGRSFAGIAGTAMAVLAGRMLVRVFPLVPRR